MVKSIQINSKNAFKKIIDGYEKIYNIDPSFVQVIFELIQPSKEIF